MFAKITKHEQMEIFIFCPLYNAQTKWNYGIFSVVSSVKWVALLLMSRINELMLDGALQNVIYIKLH